MCQKALKVKLKDKKEIKENKKKKDTIFSIFLPGTCNKGRKTDSRERKSNFSLDFSAFGPSILVGTRGKVDLRYKGYAWTPIL